MSENKNESWKTRMIEILCQQTLVGNIGKGCWQAVWLDIEPVISSELERQRKRLREAMGFRTPKDLGDEKVDPNPSDAFIQGKREMEYKTSEEAPCIRATQYKSGDNQPRLLQDARIRRLTPRECERLMSWPDDWTEFGAYDNGHAIAPISDTQRYKMCGNGVVSEVVAAVVKAHLL